MTDSVDNVQTEQSSPNDNWQEDTRLDGNGNPVEETVVEKTAPAEKPEKRHQQIKLMYLLH